MRLETSGDNPFTTSAVYGACRVSVLSNSVRARPQIQGIPTFRHTMHWRRKLGIVMCFAFMPAMASLWGMALGIETNTMIRILTVLFIPGLLMALGSSGPEVKDSNSN